MPLCPTSPTTLAATFLHTHTHTHNVLKNNIVYKEVEGVTESAAGDMFVPGRWGNRIGTGGKH